MTLPRKSPLREFAGSNVYWEGKLFVAGLGRDGTVVFRPGEGGVLPDGSLGMKIGWYRGRGLRGKLIITGKRLDAHAPPLRADTSGPDTGFQASSLIFPSEGCWEVTGSVGEASLTFVTRVVRLGNNK